MKIFISYSHDSVNHSFWVEELAKRIKKLGVDIIFDKWSLALGEDINTFMEKAIIGSDLVLVICTPNYVIKSNSRKGGVGYESVLIASHILDSQETTKFIPIVRSKDSECKPMPVFLGNRLYADLSIGDGFGETFSGILNHIEELKATHEKLNIEQPESSNGLKIVLNGPYFVEKNCPTPDSALKALSVHRKGIIQFEENEIKNLLEGQSFWFGAILSEDPRIKLGVLAKLLDSQIDLTPYEKNKDYKIIVITISAPEGYISMEKFSEFAGYIDNMVPDDVTIYLSVTQCMSGFELGYALL